MGQGRKIDWSKAGVRLRHSPRDPGGNNPDWNFPASRWKTAEEYAGDTLTAKAVCAKVHCPREGCHSLRPEACRDARRQMMPESPHVERRLAAGKALIAQGWTMAALDTGAAA